MSYNRKSDRTERFNDAKHNKNLLKGSYGRHGGFRSYKNDDSGASTFAKIITYAVTGIVGAAGGAALGHAAGKDMKYTEKVNAPVDAYNVTNNATGIPQNVSVPSTYANATVVNFAPANASDAHGKVQFLYKVVNGTNETFEKLVNATIKNTPYMGNNETKIVMEQEISSDGRSVSMGNVTYSMKLLESNGSKAKILLKERFAENGLKETKNQTYIVTLNESELIIRQGRTGPKVILPRGGPTLDYLVFKDPKTNETKELYLGDVLDNMTQKSARQKDRSALMTALGLVAGSAIGTAFGGLGISIYSLMNKEEDLETVAGKKKDGVKNWAESESKAQETEAADDEFEEVVETAAANKKQKSAVELRIEGLYSKVADINEQISQTADDKELTRLEKARDSILPRIKELQDEVDMGNPSKKPYVGLENRHDVSDFSANVDKYVKEPAKPAAKKKVSKRE